MQSCSDNDRALIAQAHARCPVVSRARRGLRRRQLGQKRARRRKVIAPVQCVTAASHELLRRGQIVSRHDLRVVLDDLHHQALVRNPMLPIYVGHRRTARGGYCHENGAVDPARLDASVWDVARATGWSVETILAACFLNILPALWVNRSVGFVFVLEDVLRVRSGEWPAGPGPRAPACKLWRPLPTLADSSAGFFDCERVVRVPVVEPF